jgi:AcrR family transcriptional regulator
MSQILDVAEGLFGSKGYEKTTVNDILLGAEIGKGTFYHYFQSKQEVMDAVVARMVADARDAVQAVADMPGLGAHEKFMKVFTEQRGRYDHLIEPLHHEDNGVMHVKTLAETLLAISPGMGQIIRQGVEDGSYRTDLPQEAFELLFAAAQFLLDPALFKWTPDELERRGQAFALMAEAVLGAEPGSFGFLGDLEG